MKQLPAQLQLLLAGSFRLLTAGAGATPAAFMGSRRAKTCRYFRWRRLRLAWKGELGLKVNYLAFTVPSSLSTCCSEGQAVSTIHVNLANLPLQSLPRVASLIA